MATLRIGMTPSGTIRDIGRPPRQPGQPPKLGQPGLPQGPGGPQARLGQGPNRSFLSHLVRPRNMS